MEFVRRAVIDVGTNSIKLLVADVSGRDVRPVHEESRQTRLGQGFYETRQLQPESIARTAEAVWEFGEIAREKNAAAIRVIATSAARDAVNPKDLTNAIERASGRERIGKFQPFFKLQAGRDNFRRLLCAHKRAGQYQIKIRLQFLDRGADFPQLPPALGRQRPGCVILKTTRSAFDCETMAQQE